ncbi:hypothetical protein NW762_014567 [Fusarium torreyae]|uniref:Uncharacterized protein n=1 Tax=Fusarium torreyae TaxID=1237075 RepID=A0A9W8RL83_9HYPO|nr:hypothetical protein NW762_014567 [Fusarium torreyae]
MKSVIALTVLLRFALAAPLDSIDNAVVEKRQFFDSADIDDFLSSLSSLLGQTEPTSAAFETISTTVSGTPTEISTVTTTTASFDGLFDSPMERRQAPSKDQLLAIISSLESLLAPTTTTAAALGCPTDVVSVPTTVSGTPTQVLSVSGPATVLPAPTAPVDVPFGI